LGRRTEKSGTGVTTTYYLSDGTDEIAEYDSTKTVTVRYIPGPAIDELIAMETASTGAKEYFHTDKQGSVSAMSDTTGALVEGPYTYDAYGNCFVGSTPCSSSGEPYRFTGRRWDAEIGCYYYRARYYCPDDTRGGRFLQTDPVGYTADLNIYTYVGNDPSDSTDPTGSAGNTCSLVGASDCGGSYSGDGTLAQRLSADFHLGGIRNAGELLSSILASVLQASEAPSSTAAPSQGNNGCNEYCGDAKATNVATGPQLMGPGGQAFVPLPLVPKPSQYILQNRWFDPKTGGLNLSTPPGYQIVAAPSGGGYLLVPPGWQPGDNRNVIRIQPYGTGSSVRQGYSQGYFIVTNQAGAAISIYSGQQFPASSPAVHNEFGHVSPTGLFWP